MHQVGRALRGKLIVAQADSDGSACKIKAVHLLQSFSGLGCITEPEISQLEFVSSIHERKTKGSKVEGWLTEQIRIHGYGHYRPSGVGHIPVHQMAQRRLVGLVP